ncbi:MAG TPA: hypothetical protein PLL26_04010 [Candidatus Dojkabacteria bacterium]|nr:hypothetical protein [Candidatus Dojkabacteria bacterium]
MVSNVLIPLLNNNNLQKDEVKSSYNEFTNGKINEEAFWSRLKINNYFEIRKK